MTIKVFVVDDSATVRTVLKLMLDQDPDIDVIAAAASADIAIRKMKSNWPDVIISDLEMPGMHGLEFLRWIRDNHPTPFIVCSSHVGSGAQAAVEALALGAVDVIEKPKVGVQSYLEEITQSIILSVKAAAHASVKHAAPAESVVRQVRTQVRKKPVAVIGIGSSTGGTQIIEFILKRCTKQTPGVVVVQHMPQYFTAAFAKRLNTVCDIDIREAVDGDMILSGTALIAPGGKHLEVVAAHGGFSVRVSDEPPCNRHKPSVDVLFRSMAREVGENAVGIILTGMGVDGAAGLLEMSKAGATTIGQDEETSAVYGMPKVAMNCGAVQLQMPYHQMPETIGELVA